MGEPINLTIAADDRINEILIASPATPERGQAGMVIRSELARADGEYQPADQIGVPALASDAAAQAFVAAAAGVIPGLTLESYIAATKAGAYAARRVVRERDRAARLATIQRERAAIEARLASLNG